MLSLRAAADSASAIGNSSPYGYIPSLAPSIAYLVVFSLLTLVHAVLAYRYKYWMVFVTLMPGGTLEIVGWAGRIWSHYNVLNQSAFIMQICCLVLGPAFFSAWAYCTLGYCIQHLGPAYSLLRPRMYLAVFVAADIVSLVLQAIGGGQAAVQYEQGLLTTKATHIMLSGILFQLATMTVFVALATDFIIRAIYHRPYAFRRRQISASKSSSSAANEKCKSAKKPIANTERFSAGDISTPETTSPSGETAHSYSRSVGRRVQLFQIGVAFASLMIYVRGIYRSIELAQGWTGYVITHEQFFTWLDGLPMTLCLAAFVVAHPGWLLPFKRTWRGA